MEVYESLEYFSSWDQFVEFIRGFHFENVNKVYQQITLEKVDEYAALRHIYDEKTADAGFELCIERQGCVFFLEHGDEQSIFNIKNGEMEVKLLSNKLIQNDGINNKDEVEFVRNSDGSSEEALDKEDARDDIEEEGVDGYETDYLNSDDGGELDSEIDKGGEGT